MDDSGSGDTTVRLWDAGTGQPIGPPMTGHEGSAYSVAFSPHGNLLVSGGEDGALRLWLAYPDFAAAMRQAHPNMSEYEWEEWVSPDIDYIEACPGLPIRSVM